MSTANSIIARVSKYLTDHEAGYEYTHWSKDDLLDYLRLSIAAVSAADRSKFTEHRIIELKEGSMHDLSDACPDAKIIAYGDDSLGEFIPVRRTNKDISVSINRPICAATGAAYSYKMLTWGSAGDGYVWVHPPIPKGETVKVRVSCFTPTEVHSFDQELHLSPVIEAAVFEMMLYYAFGVDIESVAMRERSESHFNKAYTILGVALTAAGTRKTVSSR